MAGYLFPDSITLTHPKPTGYLFLNSIWVRTYKNAVYLSPDKQGLLMELVDTRKEGKIYLVLTGW